MQNKDLVTLQHQLCLGELTVGQIVEHYLERINSSADHNVFLEVYGEEARTKARDLDAKITSGQPLGRLFGAVISLKDIISYAGHAVQGGSNILQGYRASYTATTVERLLNEDVIVIGRVNCDEFAMGSSNENSAFGPVLNPYDKTRIPGGSSGGSAAAIALDTCLVSIASDTGGSVRQPAAFCNVIGFKPSYGAFSRYGLLAYASSLDQIGLIGRHTTDLFSFYSVMAGPDVKDATSLLKPLQKPTDYIDHFPIAYWDDLIGVDERIVELYKQQLNTFREAGYLLKPWDTSLKEFLVPAYYILSTAEASSNLSRYDGIRYGYRYPEAEHVEDLITRSRTEGFGQEVKRRLMMGSFVLSAGYYDAYYAQAQKVRALLIQAFNDLFRTHQALLMPVSPVWPWRIGEKVEDPVSVYQADIFTVMANLAGIPAIAFPAGFSDLGLPMGIQLMAPRQQDDLLFKLLNNK